MSEPLSWADANRRYLQAALNRLRQQLQGNDSKVESIEATEARLWEDRLAEGLERPPALLALQETFGLSSFERDLLLLVAGPELEASFASALTELKSNGEPVITFSFALERLPEAHWSALSPEGPLRRWRMLEISDHRGLAPITGGALRIDERILHYLTGVDYLDERLRGWIEAVNEEVEITPSQSQLAQRIAAVWTRSAGAGQTLPVVELAGPGEQARRAIAAAVCAELGLALHQTLVSFLPTGATELDGLVRLWQRESALSASALYLEVGDADEEDQQRRSALQRLLDRVRGPVFVGTREHLRSSDRPALSFSVELPAASEQVALWREVLGPQRARILDGRLENLAAQFRLGVASLVAATEEALGEVSSDESSQTTHWRGDEAGDELATALWKASRRQARPALGHLAQRIPPLATWSDIVLPEHELAALRQIAVHARQRATVYERWGFGARSNRGLGISVLFAGTSGTGKTMAAEVLANELELDLYRIDLAAIISKYIGETEKNLRRVFDAAEAGGAILLFDEADALFGKRSEVKDSHDRYANIEVSYLLQRMEAYSGLAILTSNRKSALDQAFLRRLRFVLEFPFPDAGARSEIWRRIFPSETPTRDLDLQRLGQLNVAGGNIRNIALGAAFRAAEASRPVTMADVQRAAELEYLKLEKPLGQSELRGWPAEETRR
jgi:hypothetical protein